MKGFMRFLILGLLVGCGPTDIHIDWAHRPTSFVVKLLKNPGPKDKALPLNDLQVTATLDITALSAEGMKPLKEFSKWVHIYVRPGILKVTKPDTAYNPAVAVDPGAYVYLKNGRIDGVQVQLKLCFGATRIWVEDDGFLPPTVGKAQCADGRDNDHDGLVDMADPGCKNALDHSEEDGTGAAGVSGIINFQSPRLSDVQGHADQTPYPHEEVDVTRGFMVVTRVTNSGFYVTDIEDSTGYNSIYVYNYSIPPFLRACDRITDLSGTVSEFYGFTELNFPSWSRIPWYKDRAPCYVPDPTVLQPSMLSNPNKMEALESGLVRIVNAETGDKPKVCDFNNNGKVCGNHISESKECRCRSNCDKDPYCSTLLNYQSYGQWAAVIHNNKSTARVWVVSNQTVPGFDPFKDGGRRHVSSITGTLKEFKYLKPPWIIEVRCPDDIVVTGNPKRANESCIYPRTGAIDAPN